ncbi:MAG TPA: hypothetical protein DD939_19705 [Sulfitobacter pontiacus]|nr:hypothetical protein [Sulfitobacter pontiacus]
MARRSLLHLPKGSATLRCAPLLRRELWGGDHR